MAFIAEKIRLTFQKLNSIANTKLYNLEGVTLCASFASTLYRKRGLCENVRLKLNMIARFRYVN